MFLCHMHLHHRDLWNGSDCLESVFHLFQTTWNVFLKQYGEMGSFSLPFSLVNPAGNVPEQQPKSRRLHKITTEKVSDIRYYEINLKSV